MAAPKRTTQSNLSRVLKEMNLHQIWLRLLPHADRKPYEPQDTITFEPALELEWAVGPDTEITFTPEADRS